ncbi:MAG TPA: hypothetical protein EYQ02_03010, partial [Microbacterium sp.]|nr:hypothetical protein [Microbacterium sp.]
MHRELGASPLQARMLLQVHDELVFEVDAAVAEELISVARAVMEKLPHEFVVGPGAAHRARSSGRRRGRNDPSTE